MLVHHEFRRYVRIPVITEVSVVMSDNQRFSASSQEISSGGMSLKSSEEVVAIAVAGDFICAVDVAADMGSQHGHWRKPAQ